MEIIIYEYKQLNSNNTAQDNEIGREDNRTIFIKHRKCVANC